MTSGRQGLTGKQDRTFCGDDNVLYTGRAWVTQANVLVKIYLMSSIEQVSN